MSPHSDVTAVAIAVSVTATTPAGSAPHRGGLADTRLRQNHGSLGLPLLLDHSGFRLVLVPGCLAFGVCP